MSHIERIIFEPRKCLIITPDETRRTSIAEAIDAVRQSPGHPIRISPRKTEDYLPRYVKRIRRFIRELDYLIFDTSDSSYRHDIYMAPRRHADEHLTPRETIVVCRDFSNQTQGKWKSHIAWTSGSMTIAEVEASAIKQAMILHGVLETSFALAITLD